MSDLVIWARDLYTGPILTSSERRQLEALVSTETGKPISGTSAANPRGFGLGVSQVTRAPIGTFWFYIGETLGFRVAHVYVPSTGITLALGLNSQPSPSQDHIGALISQVYETVLAATSKSGSARKGAAQPR
jgi:D-alanyl-D-alanine carboxypeptidase